MNTAVQVVLGVAFTVVILALIIWLVGVEQFLRSVSRIEPRYVGAILSLIVLRQVAKGIEIYVAFDGSGLDLSAVRAVFLSAGISFVKKVMPFAQFGGEPVAAEVATKATGAPYEESLAALSTIETIRFVPSTTIFVGGSLYFLAFPTPVPRFAKLFFALFAVVFLLVLLAAYILWRYQDAAETVAVDVLDRAAAVAGFLPFVSRPDRAAIRDRVTGFSSLFVDLTTDRRLVAIVAGLAFFNVVVTAAELWLSLRAVGVGVPFALLLFAVPFSQLASILPVPGGVGGVEAVLVGFVTALTAHSARAVTTGVIVSNGLGYWVTIVTGTVSVVFVLSTLREAVFDENAFS